MLPLIVTQKFHLPVWVKDTPDTLQMGKNPTIKITNLYFMVSNG